MIPPYVEALSGLVRKGRLGRGRASSLCGAQQPEGGAQAHGGGRGRERPLQGCDASLRFSGFALSAVQVTLCGHEDKMIWLDAGGDG